MTRGELRKPYKGGRSNRVFVRRVVVIAAIVRRTIAEKGSTGRWSSRCQHRPTRQATSVSRWRAGKVRNLSCGVIHAGQGVICSRSGARQVGRRGGRPVLRLPVSAVRCKVGRRPFPSGSAPGLYGGPLRTR